MDGEISYESDISESWSLIDVNLNEEFLPLTETSSNFKNCSSIKLKNVNAEKVNEVELDDFLKKFNKINKADFNRLSDSDSDFSLNHQALENCDRTNLNRNESSFETNLVNYEINDSGDAESIEILHVDENNQEIDGFGLSSIDQLEFSPRHLDNEESSESSEERSKNRNRSNTSTVIKKKRRINKNLNDTVNNINSENKYPDKNSLNVCSNDTNEELNNLNEESNRGSCNSVYKHFRNNVLNTELNWPVCAIFAGVACIAIGHFWGVQNATDTAVELMESMKKLQVENFALQSCLFHINRALLTREMNQKLEPSLGQSLNKSKITPSNTSKTEDADLNIAALSEIHSSLNSFECLFKLQNFVRKNKKETEIENEIDYKTFGKYIRDELCFLTDIKEVRTESLKNGYKLRKISRLLRKIINLMTASKDNIEKFYQRLIKLKEKLNYTLSQVLLDIDTGEIEKVRSKYENTVPVTEVDLQTTQWDSRNGIQKHVNQENLESNSLYQFPQPENYYKIESDIKNAAKIQLEPTKSYRISNKNGVEKMTQEKKNQKESKRKNMTEKMKEKKNRKTKKLKEKYSKRNKRGKRKILPNNLLNKVGGNVEKINKMYDATIDSRPGNYKIRQSSLNETKSHNKMYYKSQSKDLRFKRKLKNMKNSKLKKVFLPELKKDFYLKKNQFSQTCSVPQCFNLSGHWVFKWADGREEYRRHQSLGEWQFERAKARKKVREIDNNDNWQFDRAKARKELRANEQNENWQFKRASARKSNRNYFSSLLRKYTKHPGKEFLHERFSWI